MTTRIVISHRAEDTVPLLPRRMPRVSGTRHANPIVDDQAVEALAYYAGIITPLMIRACKGCAETYPHSYHLTWWGCWCFDVPVGSGPEVR